MSPAILNKDITLHDTEIFVRKVLDRFCNPFIEHLWLSISVQYTSKMKSRNLPVLEKYYISQGTPPAYMALGFAAYLLFMKSEKDADNKYKGTLNGKQYIITDDFAARLSEHWQGKELGAVVGAVLKDTTLWDKDLTTYPGFEYAVTLALESLVNKGFALTVNIL